MLARCGDAMDYSSGSSDGELGGYKFDLDHGGDFATQITVASETDLPSPALEKRGDLSKETTAASEADLRPTASAEDTGIAKASGVLLNDDALAENTAFGLTPETPPALGDLSPAEEDEEEEEEQEHEEPRTGLFPASLTRHLKWPLPWNRGREGSPGTYVAVGQRPEMMWCACDCCLPVLRMLGRGLPRKHHILSSARLALHEKRWEVDDGEEEEQWEEAVEEEWATFPDGMLEAALQAIIDAPPPAGTLPARWSSNKDAGGLKWWMLAENP